MHWQLLRCFCRNKDTNLKANHNDFENDRKGVVLFLP